ncbi:MFS transporter, partial [Bacillus cereus]
TDPQGLYSMLFSPEALKQMPEAFANSIVPILKNSLVDSLHTVFLTGLVFIVVGAIFTVFLQKIKLSDRKKGAEEPTVEEKEDTVSYS